MLGEGVGVAWTDLEDEWVKWIFQKCSEGLPMSTVQNRLQVKQMVLSTGITEFNRDPIGAIIF